MIGVKTNIKSSDTIPIHTESYEKQLKRGIRSIDLLMIGNTIIVTISFSLILITKKQRSAC